MSTHAATVIWTCSSPDFLRGKYSREHTWSFDGGVTVLASSSPSVVPVPYSNPTAVDPEEAFVASISSCHMLTFLYLASKKGFQVQDYRDEAVGTMSRGATGVSWVSSVVLDPKIVFIGDRLPTPTEIAHLHHEAHQQCFIAQSIKTEVTIASAAT